MPNYTYTRDIPNGPNNPSADQPIMQTNANSTDSILDIDLYGFNDNNGGFHQKSTYVVQGSDPVPLNTDGAQGIVYTKTVSGIAELFINRFGSATPIQLTKGAISASASGYTFLPGGIIIQWGTASASSGGSTNNFPLAFPTSAWAVVPTEIGNDRLSISVDSLGLSSFKAYCSVARNIYYIAIGN